ncbi:MAG: glycosyltransferase family 2 protein [Pseudomonadota bacterium]
MTHSSTATTAPCDIDLPTFGIDVCIVTYHPDVQKLDASLASLCEQGVPREQLRLVLYDNSCDDAVFADICTVAAAYESRFERVRCEQSNENVGFGIGNNTAVSLGHAEYVLVLNQDIRLEPGALAQVVHHARSDAEGGLWELRQIPYEHPKWYDPVSLETPWSSGAVFVVRRDTFESIGGFDPDIFMYGEDVDLSWRVRAAGRRLRYLPWAAGRHDTYDYAGQVKPLQALEGTYSNLYLRAKFGALRTVGVGLLQLAAEVCAPQDFPGRRRGLLRIGRRFLGRLWRIRRQHASLRQRGAGIAEFRVWDYAVHRDGAFEVYRERAQWQRQPLVSILIRTCNRPHLLREALLTATRQTYPNVEVVVVEDGEGRSSELIDAEFGDHNVRYIRLGTQQGRSVAGNRALQESRGEWCCFLDDDDGLYLDHVESLLQVALAREVDAAYGWAWEVPTQFHSLDPLRYDELPVSTVHKSHFDYRRLLTSNFLPIQSVLFKRTLFEQKGGFAEDMDQLEDWNLWVRYATGSAFVHVDKTTSRYRVPAEQRHSVERQARLDAAYEDAKARHAHLLGGEPDSPPQAVEPVTGAHCWGVRDRARSVARRAAHTAPGGRHALWVYRVLRRRLQRAQ